MTFIRKNITFLVVLLVLFTLMLWGQNVSAQASQKITVRVNETVINFDAEPQMINDVVMAPVKGILEAFDASFSDDEELRTVIASKGDITIRITEGSEAMLVNDEEISMESPATVLNDKLFVPVQQVAREFGYAVEWDEGAGCVSISESQTEADLVKTIYAPDGRTANILKSSLDAYLNVGWYAEPVITIYSPNGKSAVIAKSEKKKYQNVGWYTEPVITMYSPKGKSIVIYKSEKENYRNVGWYTVPVSAIYTLDGKIKVVAKAEVDAYRELGWYCEEEFVTGNEKLDAMVEEALAQCIESDMTLPEKLRAAYLYVRDTYTYLGRAHHKRGATDFTEESATFMFENGKGNCYCFASCFLYMARRLGFHDAVIVSGGVGTNNADHAWVVIGSKIYDVELEYAYHYRYAVKKSYNLYAMPYNGTPFPYYFPN